MEQTHYFIAISLPTSIKRELFEIQNYFKTSVSYRDWTHIDDFHITLKFLGNVHEDQLNLLIQSLTKEITKLPAVTLKPVGIGTFGNVTQPRVLWFGVESSVMLKTLYDLVDSITNKCKFPSEKRAYTPHITLAKKWSQTDKHVSSLVLNQELPIQMNNFLVEQVVLYRIYPEESPKYKAVHIFDLKGCADGSVN